MGKYISKFTGEEIDARLTKVTDVVTAFPTTPLDTDVPSTKLVKDNLDDLFENKISRAERYANTKLQWEMYYSSKYSSCDDATQTFRCGWLDGGKPDYIFDFTLEEAEAQLGINDFPTGMSLIPAEGKYASVIRTEKKCIVVNLAPYGSNGPLSYRIGSDIAFARGSKILILNTSRANHYNIQYLTDVNFYHSSYLTALIGNIYIETWNGKNYGCERLVEVRFSNLKISCNISNMPALSRESIRYMIDNAINTEAITLTVHASVYARLTQEDLDLATSKNITIVTP